jgi:hypothetical protein
MSVKRIRGAIGTVCLTVALIASNPWSASATTIFNASWGAGSYHASSDYLPGAGNIYVGGYGGSGGSARYWYTELLKTSGPTHVFSSYSYPADGYWHDDGRLAAYTSGGVAYYQRWYGQDAYLTGGYSAPYAGVRAYR